DDSLGWLPAEAGEPNRPGQPALLPVACADAASGMSRSLQCGLAALGGIKNGPGGVLILLADQPLVTTGHLNRLLEAFAANPAAAYVASGDNGKPKPPLILARCLYPELLQLRGDVGARALLDGGRYSGVILEADDPNLFLDADTPEDLAAIAKLLP
uniref:nucleotidyltransferase family protein n=1 Tax=Gorillibacterium massiliense TaxID=1280390 RepID=UPI00059387FC